MRIFLILLFSIGLFNSCSTTNQNQQAPLTTDAHGVLPPTDIPEKRDFPVNPEVNPCDDFYAYTCSKVESQFRLRDDRSVHVFSFNDASERLLSKKKTFLTQLDTEPQTIPRRLMLRTVYRACMNISAATKEERGLVGEAMEKIYSIRTHEVFRSFLASRMVSPDFSFVQFGSVPNQQDPEVMDVAILSRIMTLPEPSYYEKPELVSAVGDLAIDFLKALGQLELVARGEEVASFEKRFAAVFPRPAELRERFNQKREVSRSELLTKYPNLGLGELLKHIPEKTKLRNITPEALEFLNGELGAGNLNTLKDVYIFHDLIDYLDDAYPRFFSRRFEFQRTYLGGPLKRPLRDERCTRMIMDDFQKELDAELLPQLFPNFPEERVRALAGRIRRAIASGIRNNSWLGKPAKQAALAKIEQARLQMIKPQNDAEWNFTPPAEYSESTPYKNSRLLRLNLQLKEISELKEKRNQNRWMMGPLTINAYYSAADNKFVLPIGVLQYPFFDPELPDEANLAAIGMVVAHELGHAIDDMGSRYDAKGRLNVWMSPMDLKQFKKHSRGLLIQFNSIGYNGELTLGENIGDLVGLTFAYQAAFPGGQGSQELKKDFFTQFGRVWCTVIRPKARELLMKTDPHPIGDARVNQQVKHQKGFQEAFECKPKDQMVLPDEKRVRIW